VRIVSVFLQASIFVIGGETFLLEIGRHPVRGGLNDWPIDRQ
jgi:hypothetical protein